uniref:Uncharacterized protein n=1 Tax=Ixodes ricinus TaxID=34613 RepID=A0A6B0UT00_IXORI
MLWSVLFPKSSSVSLKMEYISVVTVSVLLTVAVAVVFASDELVTVVGSSVVVGSCECTIIEGMVPKLSLLLALLSVVVVTSNDTPSTGDSVVIQVSLELAAEEFEVVISTTSTVEFKFIPVVIINIVVVSISDAVVLF